ncbi:hypothetical protein WBJ53_23265 [Spirosoma sp. SC4-14]|uniref:hypothetical protein n=1 Tax=Spirosoma sp. SC4-14 TaxID=3128900 RepID=UPI0030CB15D9
MTGSLLGSFAGFSRQQKRSDRLALYFQYKNMIGLFFLIILIILVGIPYALYWIPKKLGYPGLGRVLSYSIGAIFILLVFFAIFEDALFSKSDAEELLAEQNTKLIGDFDLLENKSMSAIGDYYHTFTLKISDTDKRRIIQSIRNASDFRTKNTETWIDDSLFQQPNRYTGKKIIRNYETKPYFIRELFEPQGIGYAPKFRRIKISKKDDTLIFEDIDE